MYLYELKKIKNIAILWFWREGKSTLNFLLRLWINKDQITVLDKNDIHNKIEGVNYNLWEKYLDNLWNFNLIFKTPWISPYIEKILPYREKLTSQAEIFFSNYEWKTIWVTGTKGKSTISTLIYETLKNAQYNVKLVGNIWNPVFDEIDLLDPDNYNYIIYELSSYMLETFQPECSIAVLSNIYTCHLDWHNNDFWVYEQAKLNIITNSHNKIISWNFRQYWQKLDNVYFFWKNTDYHFDNKNFYKKSEKLFSSEKLLLLWEHNKINITSALAVIDAIVDNYNHRSVWIFSKLVHALEKTLETFSWLPYRLEKVWEYKNITFIDDGISTTPESTIEAIRTFWDKINTLFLGGWDYWFTQDSYDLLKKEIVKYNINNLVLFPDTWLDIFNLSRDSKIYWDIFEINIWENKINVLFTNQMKDAVKFAYKNTWTWNICLMSCAAPSYSIWSWYEEKWRLFKKYIEEQKN